MNRAILSRFLSEAMNQRWSRFLYEATGNLYYGLLLPASLAQGVEGHDVEVGLRVGLVADVTTED